MPKVTVTFDFTSEAEAAAFLSGKEHKPHVEHNVGKGEPHERGSGGQPLPCPTNGQLQQNAVTTGTQNTPAPQADAPAAKTPNDVNLAFVAYVKKGQGRTAATAKAILTKYGINSFREANSEQCAQLVAEYEAA